MNLAGRDVFENSAWSAEFWVVDRMEVLAPGSKRLFSVFVNINIPSELMFVHVRSNRGQFCDRLSARVVGFGEVLLFEQPHAVDKYTFGGIIH